MMIKGIVLWMKLMSGSSSRGYEVFRTVSNTTKNTRLYLID
jgi:hypothetical protein